MSEQMPQHHERVIRDPAILAGKPVIKGTRIPVDLILKHLAENRDPAELFAAYPRLTAEDVQAAISCSEAVDVSNCEMGRL